MTTLEQSLYLLLFSFVYCFSAGLLTRNYSQVDRLWSVLPPLYALIWWQEVPSSNLRYIIGAILVILWGTRLTGNFARRGGYRFSMAEGFYDEDYRWPILKEKISNRFLFEIFNLTFICGFQLGLIFLFTLPLYYVGQSNTLLTSIDYLIASLFLLFLILEWTADNQQWKFQNEKRSPERAKDSRYQVGFNTFGLWKFMRHPNYIMEMSQWLMLWLLANQATQSMHWTGAGVAILMILFVGSTIMAESITQSKYPLYSLWKKATPPWIPFLDFPLRDKGRKKFWATLGKKD